MAPKHSIILLADLSVFSKFASRSRSVETSDVLSSQAKHSLHLNSFLRYAKLCLLSMRTLTTYL